MQNQRFLGSFLGYVLAEIYGLVFEEMLTVFVGLCRANEAVLDNQLVKSGLHRSFAHLPSHLCFRLCYLVDNGNQTVPHSTNFSQELISH